MPKFCQFAAGKGKEKNTFIAVSYFKNRLIIFVKNSSIDFYSSKLSYIVQVSRVKNETYNK